MDTARILYLAHEEELSRRLRDHAQAYFAANPGSAETVAPEGPDSLSGRLLDHVLSPLGQRLRVEEWASTARKGA